METTVPASSVTLGDDHHRHWQHGFPWLGQTDQQRIADLSDRVGGLHRDTVGVIEKNGTAGALASCHTDERICNAASEIVRAVNGGADASETRDALTQSQLGTLSTAVVAYAKDAQATAYQIEGRTGLALETKTNALGVQSEKHFYALSVENVKNASAAELTAQRNAAAAMLAAEKCCCEIKEKIAECCCELKEKISARADVTDHLIQQIDRERGARELNDARSEILYLKSRVPAGTPI